MKLSYRGYKLSVLILACSTVMRVGRVNKKSIRSFFCNEENLEPEFNKIVEKTAHRVQVQSEPINRDTSNLPVH